MIEQKNFNEWDFKNSIDLMICDPPFSINFDGKASNYNRKSDLVVQGYVEWDKDEVEDNIVKLFIYAEEYLAKNGSLLLFSGWQLSNIIAREFLEIKSNIDLYHQGKLYWNYNFAPYCKKRPATNVYEIFWFTKSKKDWFYNNKCSLAHCNNGEANLSFIKLIDVKKEYLKGIPKYPTRFPSELVKIIIEHFSDKNSTILDPMCGSGIVGIISALYYPDRKIFLGDLNPQSTVVYKELLKYFAFLKNELICHLW